MGKQLATAILFSGGDAPGMNPLLRAFVRLSHKRYGAPVFGVKNGFLGLVHTAERLASDEIDDEALRQSAHGPTATALARDDQDVMLLDDASVSGLIERGGIILGSSRCPQFLEPECRARVVLLLERLGVERVVVVGGEGSLQGAAALADESTLSVIGLPATIDNDCPYTERALGFDTAVNTVADAARHFNDTAGSHRRIMVLEIMGRDCGCLAATAALAAGAEIVVTPERGSLDGEKLEGIARLLERSMQRGRRHAVVLVAEGVRTEPATGGGASKTLADFLQGYFHRPAGLFSYVDTRYSVLGHLQRGGRPTVADRLLAAEMAEAAWQFLSDSKPASGILGLVGGAQRLQGFHDTPAVDLAARIGRIYQLQKDTSKYEAGEDFEDQSKPCPQAAL